MRPHDFLDACVRYFGTWPQDKPGVLEEVTEYLRTKRPAFLEALWKLVRDDRPVGYGPPDMACLVGFAGRAAEYVQTHTVSPSVKMVEEARATQEELEAALSKTTMKIQESRVKPEELPPVRWNEKIALSPTYYDDSKWATESARRERFEEYCAKYKKRGVRGG